MVIGGHLYATGYYLYGTWVVPDRYLDATGYTFREQLRMSGSYPVATCIDLRPRYIEIVPGRIQTTTHYHTPIDFFKSCYPVDICIDFPIHLCGKWDL
ncbi:unnamed protein product [Caenorhabditis auriculariae]|uniref:Uncharacterized protein n=1 Tax=Caenorhabditis auriculariae TaxID=2777116 RepID=A0A8S1HZW7_9PELO|nr:unnamed protein product [Caenorhabditis auriculariae]